MDNVRFRHVISIGILYTLGTVLISIASRGYHAWQGLLWAFVFAIPIYHLYNKLLKQFPNKNLFEIIECSFGKIISKIVIIMYIFFLWYKAGRIIFSYMDLIITTNQLAFEYKQLMLLLNLILLGYILKNGLNNIARLSQICFIIIIILISLLFIVGIGNMDLSNILPIYPIVYSDFQKNIFYFFIQPFMELTIIFNFICKIKNYSEQKKVLFVVAFVSMVIILVIIIQTICILGKDYTLILNYPYYSCIATINVNKLIARFETISIIIFYICASIKVIVLLYCMELAISTLFHKQSNDQKYYYYIIFMSTVLSFILYDNITQLRKMTIYYCIIAIVMHIIIPIFIVFFKKKKYNTLEKKENVV